jgi:hypothetical protein
MTRVYTYLSSLPKSSSHPCSPSTHSALTSAKEGYLTSRRDYIVTRCINPVVREFDQLTEGPMSPGREEEGRKEKCRIVARVAEGLRILMQVSMSKKPCIPVGSDCAYRILWVRRTDGIRLDQSPLSSRYHVSSPDNFQIPHQDAQRLVDDPNKYH